ncbi:MAG: hypothetical protein KDD76_01580 [Rickettsiales bacterium]|nr:hypothetical protein [Rickettsiales bacterium]
MHAPKPAPSPPPPDKNIPAPAPQVEEAPTDIEEQTEVVYTAPSFFLRSIIYYNPQEWTIWLNNKKLRYGENYGKFYIVHVDENEATFIWHSDDLDIISPTWAETIPQRDALTEMVVVSDISDDKPKEETLTYRWDHMTDDQSIAIDSRAHAIRFVLRPNQSFISYRMQITEGTFSHIRIVKQVSEDGYVIPASQPLLDIEELVKRP